MKKPPYLSRVKDLNSKNIQNNLFSDNMINE